MQKRLLKLKKKAGKKSAAESIKFAEKQAKDLTGGAKLKALGLTGDPVREMENLITKGETVKLQQVAPIIQSDLQSVNRLRMP
jgi:hypothetical protein